MADYDLAIIGGGINGAGIARDAAGRGLRVLLLEQNDLGSGTSSASTKLIHGGLRYLEHGAFRLVREALTEREVLLRVAPHIVRPMRFVLPAVPGPRSPFLLRIGLFLYDWLGARRIPLPARTIDLTHHVTGQPLLRKFRSGFEYSDCWVDDSRLVALNALDAAERGATVRTRTRVTRAEREDVWRLILNAQGRRDVVTARVLVNAGGPWAGIVNETVLRLGGRRTAAARQGQPYRGAQAVRSWLRLHLPELRQARRVRAAVRGGFHADRHHRLETSPAISTRLRRAARRCSTFAAR